MKCEVRKISKKLFIFNKNDMCELDSKELMIAHYELLKR